MACHGFTVNVDQILGQYWLPTVRDGRPLVLMELPNNHHCAWVKGSRHRPSLLLHAYGIYPRERLATPRQSFAQPFFGHICISFNFKCYPRRKVTFGSTNSAARRRGTCSYVFHDASAGNQGTLALCLRLRKATTGVKFFRAINVVDRSLTI